MRQEECTHFSRKDLQSYQEVIMLHSSRKATQSHGRTLFGVSTLIVHSPTKPLVLPSQADAPQGGEAVATGWAGVPEREGPAILRGRVFEVEQVPGEPWGRCAWSGRRAAPPSAWLPCMQPTGLMALRVLHSHNAPPMREAQK